MRVLIISIVLVLFFCGFAHSVMKCVNEKGSIAFTDTQCPPGYNGKEKTVRDNAISSGSNINSGQSSRSKTNSSYSNYQECLPTEKNKSLNKMNPDPMTMNLALKLAKDEAEGACAFLLGERNAQKINGTYYSNYKECYATERNKFVAESSPNPMMMKFTFRLAKEHAEGVCAPMAR